MSGEQSLGKLVTNISTIAASLAVLIREVPPNKAEAIVTAAMMKNSWLGEEEDNAFLTLVNKYMLPAVVKGVAEADLMILKYREEKGLN